MQSIELLQMDGKDLNQGQVNFFKKIYASEI
jgi:hypothetical protein